MQTPGQLCCVAKRPSKMDEKMKKKVVLSPFSLLSASYSVVVSEFSVKINT